MIVIKVDQNVARHRYRIGKTGESSFHYVFRSNDDQMAIWKDREIVVRPVDRNIASSASCRCQSLIQLRTGQLPNDLPGQVNFLNKRTCAVWLCRQTYQEVPVCQQLNWVNL